MPGLWGDQEAVCLGGGFQELPGWTLRSPQPLWESGQVLTPLKLPVPAQSKGDSSPSSGCSEEQSWNV